MWEAWIGFVPVDDDMLNVLITKTETTQSTRKDVHWSERLTATDVQGAFARAVQPRGGRTLVDVM